MTAIGSHPQNNETLAEYMDLACVVCKHVLNGERGIMYISNTPTYLHAFCGENDHDFETNPTKESFIDISIVCFSCLYEEDESLSIIKDIPINWSARRESRSEEWTIFFDPVDDGPSDISQES